MKYIILSIERLTLSGSHIPSTLANVESQGKAPTDDIYECISGDWVMQRYSYEKCCE